MMIQWIIRHKYLALLLPVLLLIGLAGGGRLLSFENDYHMFFSEDNPQLLAFDELQDTYTTSDNILIGLQVKQGSIFTQENLMAIADITDTAWQTPYSTRVDSLANYQHTFADGDSLQVIDLIDREQQPLAIERIRQAAHGEILLQNRLITDKGDITGVNITIELPKDSTAATQGQAEAVAFVRGLREQIRQDYPQFDVYLSGLIMLNNAFPEAGEADIASLVPMAFAAVFALLIITLRNITLVLGAFVAFILTILAGMGSAGYLGFPVTPPMTSIPTIVLTIAVAGSVHLMTSFMRHMRQGEDKVMAMTHAFEHNKRAISIASITTAIGFLGLNFSEIPPFHDMGNVAAISTLISLLMTLVFLPAWAMAMPIKVKVKESSSQWNMSGLAEFVIKQKNRILGFGGLLALVLLSLISQNEINDNFVEYFDERVEFRRDADQINDNLTGIGSIEYSFNSGESSGIANPIFLQEVERFANWMRTQSEVNNVNSLGDVFKRLNKNMHGDDQAFYRLPEAQDLAAQYLLLYEMSLPYGLDLNNQINIDKSAIKVSVNTKNLSSNEYIDLERRAHQWMMDNTPSILTEGASPSIMFAYIGKRNVEAMFLGTSITLVVISLLLVFFLRSAKIGLISLIPNLMPAALAFGIWALIDGQVTMALSVVASITLGIIVDDTVHFLSKFQEAFERLGKSVEDSIRYAFAHVGSALVITSVALSLGFLVLANSVFQINSGMGQLTSIVIMMALLMDLLLLPALLLVFNKEKK